MDVASTNNHGSWECNTTSPNNNVTDPPASETSSQDRTSLRRAHTRRASKTSAICRTCGKCRSKKVKCDGIRPTCGYCAASNHVCTYPEDGRRAGRLTKAEVLALQNEVSAFRHLFKNQPDTQALANHQLQAEPSQQSPDTDTYVVERHTASPIPAASNHVLNTPPRSADGLSTQHDQPQTLYPRRREDADPDASGPSTFETQIACAIEEDGTIQVHGVTSHLHQRPTKGASDSDEATPQNSQLAQTQLVKDHLFANAARLRQREATLFGPSRGLGTGIDLDGLPVELAVHLLDLHWNRQHFAYLLTYRPAIIDSLTNNGPYANKLLLNAMYYSSCLYSDRIVFRSDVADPSTMGDSFYRRFKLLLVDEIDRPSLPTIVALLLCGTTLVSNGKQSSGWVLCGIAYRMVIDLGCHLSVETRRSRKVENYRLTAIEKEMRTRIYWGAFLTDKFQSLYLGRPSALRPSEARVCKTLLDTYEELENWTPYRDPEQSLTSINDGLGNYQPRPAYAITTFQALIPLGEIASSIATIFYGIDSIKIPAEEHISSKLRIQAGLETWRKNLPMHLHFDPKVDPTPPPNQITPHATYHTLTILLERPFLENGHLSFCSTPSSQAEGEAKCTNAAFEIWHIVDAYKRTFTLRRVPYLLSYATYSAIVVILNQSQAQTRSPKFVECIRFFWFALLDLQRGCNTGLGKPLKILQTLMQRLGQSIPDWDPRETLLKANPGHAPMMQHPMDVNGNVIGYDEDIGGMLPVYGSADVPGLDILLQQSMEIGSWTNENWMDTMMNDQGLMDDSLYGLFTPVQPARSNFGQTQ